MPAGGKRPGAGAKKGVPHRKGVKHLQAAEIADIRAEARKYSAAALSALADLCGNAKNEAVRRAAAADLLARGYGAPRQEVGLSNPAGGPVQIEHLNLKGLSDEQLAALERLVVNLVLSATGGTGGPAGANHPAVDASDVPSGMAAPGD